MKTETHDANHKGSVAGMTLAAGQFFKRKEMKMSVEPMAVTRWKCVLCGQMWKELDSAVGCLKKCHENIERAKAEHAITGGHIPQASEDADHADLSEAVGWVADASYSKLPWTEDTVAAVKAGDTRLLLNGIPPKVDCRILSEGNYQHAKKCVNHCEETRLAEEAIAKGDIAAASERADHADLIAEHVGDRVSENVPPEEPLVDPLVNPLSSVLDAIVRMVQELGPQHINDTATPERLRAYRDGKTAASICRKLILLIDCLDETEPVAEANWQAMAAGFAAVEKALK